MTKEIAKTLKKQGVDLNTLFDDPPLKQGVQEYQINFYEGDRLVAVIDLKNNKIDQETKNLINLLVRHYGRTWDIKPVSWKP